MRKRHVFHRELRTTSKTPTAVSGVSDRPVVVPSFVSGTDMRTRFDALKERRRDDDTTKR